MTEKRQIKKQVREVILKIAEIEAQCQRELEACEVAMIQAQGAYPDLSTQGTNTHQSDQQLPNICMPRFKGGEQIESYIQRFEEWADFCKYVGAPIQHQFRSLFDGQPWKYSTGKSLTLIRSR